jgi:DNA-binding Xre family transcriptional regulator
MSVTVNNKFGVMLAEKRAQEKRNIPLAEVSEATGIPTKTLFSWANNTVTRFDVHVIDAICKYFGVKPGELFEYVEDDSPPKVKAKVKVKA